MSTDRRRVCLVEDDAIMGQALADRLQIEGYECEWVRDGASARRSLASRPYDAVVCDLRLPDAGGETIFEEAQARGAGAPPFVFMTAYGTVDVAVRLLKRGARDYLTKPLDMQAMLRAVRTICDDGPRAGADGTLGVSAPMRAIATMLPRVARGAGTVLVTGESGVGKEEVARALHRAVDPEGRSPFVAVNCGALTETLLEAELFGHVRGAFTGAVRDKKGVFELAEGGTLFLDEIAEMSMPMQVRLLRVLQDRQVRRVGSESWVPVSIRLVCATHQDLRALVLAGRFREDLFYRIHVIHVHVPPLRERRDDIVWLARRLLEAWARERGERRRLSPGAERALTVADWPGNVRELKHCLERACILSRSPVLTAAHLFGESAPPVPSDEDEALLPLARHLERCERAHIERCLRAHDGRIAQTAAALGISRKGLWQKMRRLRAPEGASVGPDARGGAIP